MKSYMQDPLNMNGNNTANGNHDTTKRQAGNTIALQTLLDKVLKNWYWFAASVIVMLLLATAYLWYATPAYKINARIQVLNSAQSDNSFSGQIGDQMNGLAYGKASVVDDELEILKSRSLIEKVVKDLSLNVTYYVKDGIKKKELPERRPFTLQWIKLNHIPKGITYTLQPEHDNGFVLRQDDVTIDAAWNDTIHVPEGDMILHRNAVPFEKEEYIVRTSSIPHTAAVYSEWLSVIIPNKQVSMIDLSLSSVLPEKGETVLNRLIENYIQLCIEDKNRLADSTIAFIDNRLGGVSGELTGIEKDIQQFRQTNDLANLQEQSRQLVAGSSDYMKQLTEQQVKLNVVESLENYMRDATSSKRVVPSSLILQDPTFLGLVERYNTLQLERERRLMLSTESNPVIKNIDQQLNSLHIDMQNNLASLKHNIRATINGLEQQAGNINRKMRQVPGEERLFVDYSRQQSIKQELYIFLLKRREEAAISKTSHLVNVRIIDAARSEELPFRPRKDLVYMLALVLGIGLAAAAIYLHSLMNKKILNKEDVTSTLPVPVLAEIGHCRKKELLIAGDPGSLVAEQFRALRTDLLLMLNRTKGKVILLTSGTSGEGKTLVSTNLAFMLALSGKRVALLEMDLRNPGVCRLLNLQCETGFSRYATGEIPYEQLFMPSGIHHNCEVIPAGPIPGNPAELLLSVNTERMMTKLRETFDYIVVDTAPIGHVTDARILAPFADITLYIVRQQYTRKLQLQLIKELYRNKKFPALQIVINDIKLTGNTYGYTYGNFKHPRPRANGALKV